MLYAQHVTIAMVLFRGENDCSRTADLLCIMAESPDLVAKALNRPTDEVFTDILADRNRGSLSDLIYKLLYSAPDPSDADDSGKLAMNNDNQWIFTKTLHSQSPTLESWMALESWRSWKLNTCNSNLVIDFLFR